MALNLNIPTLKDKPFITAETSTDKIETALTKLASNNALDFAAHLRGELTVLNRQKVPALARIDALNVYRTRAIETAQTLTLEFINANLPLHDKAKLAANAVEGLWQELGYGYKLALIDLQNQLINLSRKKISIIAIQHAIHAITEQTLVYFQTYRTIPESIWADLYQLYFCAVQMGIQHQTNPDSTIGVWTNSTGSFSIENAFKLAMLMYLSNPQNLTQKAIRIAANYLAQHVQHAQITAVTPLQTTYGAFVIDLGDNKPPSPYNKQPETPDPHVDILMQTIALVRVIHQDLNQLQQALFNKGHLTPQDPEAEDKRNLLTHLIKHLGITPQRQFQRSRKVGELELVTGIGTAHFLSSHQNTDHRTTNHAEANKQSVNTKATASRWHVINMSATGMCIRRHASAEKNIQIGQLISYKMKNEHHWGIGVVRWAHCGNRDALVIGIQFIAPFAQSATTQDIHTHTEEAALILPESASPNKQSDMVASRNTFIPGLRLKVQWDAEQHDILCTRLIERTQHFDRIQFKLLKR